MPEPLVNPPFGYFAPGSSLFSNPLGSNVVISPRMNFYQATSSGSVPGNTLGGASQTIPIDPAYPRAGRGYLIEYGGTYYGQFSGTPGSGLIAGTLAAIAPTGVGIVIPIGFPTVTTLQPVSSVQLFTFESQFIFLTSDIVTMMQNGVTGGGPPLNIIIQCSVRNTDPTNALTFQVTTFGWLRFIDGIYG